MTAIVPVTNIHRAHAANILNVADQLLFAQKRAVTHIEVEIFEDIDNLLGTVSPGPYAYTLTAEARDHCEFRQLLIETREDCAVVTPCSIRSVCQSLGWPVDGHGAVVHRIRPPGDIMFSARCCASVMVVNSSPAQ
ncbi:hypothetical protein [Rhodococcus sp. NCIMB 12038]|jgi:hypothetical protein|uniref:hypothetical protein n=1 Tax=Rhodococcus sp. NCIMB 12038 TaxID=933800 RepID=UPI000B3C3518|nr:hypothetical protein [Rhodococcus sp. NCIMB 12038]OUS92353.1 hypothetical protein CA951_29680 [Rhodococcus sp. NCIMB 12038]